MTALISGEVQLIFGTPPVVLPFAKSGSIKILGTTGKERALFLPEVPTLIEAGIKDFNTAPWQGIIAPAGTPAGIIDRRYKQVLEVLRTPYTHERFAAVGTDVVGNSPKEFAQLIARELEQNSKVIKVVGMKGD